ncbi:MAG: nitrous oxide-stimulated promoter family protein [Spirochaetes bacterium]|nr:nitrous oxide-stimulated promoter family protein [Spirochaetota bacterium]
MNTISSDVQKDIEILAEFIHIYCEDHHRGVNKFPAVARGAAGRSLDGIPFVYCDECRGLLLHAVSKRLICPYDPKPSCKKCSTHCYAPEYRVMIRKVMRHSGMRLITRGRLRLIKKYFFE